MNKPDNQVAGEKQKPIDKNNPEEIQKRNLRQKIREIKQKIEEEQKLINQFYIEKERLNDNWMTLRKENQKKDSQIANQKRDLFDSQEKNMFGLNLYRERVKQIMMLKERNNAERILEIENVIKDLEDENRVLEKELSTDNRGMGREVKEYELNHRNFVFNMKMQGDKTSTLIQSEFEKQARDLKNKFDLKIHKIRQEMEEYSARRISQLEEEKDEKIKELTVFHNNKYRDIKNYYSDITTTNLTKIRDLKGEIQIAQMTDEKDRKVLLKAEETFKRLSEPLKMITDEIDRLEEDKKKWALVKKEKTKLRDMIADLEKMYRDIEYAYEIKFQQYTFLEDEYNRIGNHFDHKIEEIYQKTGLKNLVLENQLKLLKENIEVKDLEIKNILLSCGLNEGDKAELVMYIRNITETKEKQIEDLKRRIIQVRSAHIQMVNAYHSQMKEQHIPLNELGFLPKIPKLEEGIDI